MTAHERNRRSPGDPISDAAKANIKELLANPKRKVDTSDIPELPADAWKHAVRGRFYRPLKEAVSLRLDADVLAWLKKDGAGCQTRANRILREQMLKDLEGR
ncbi:MAG: BrnA antitoxin family protein [Acidobacteriaceae bacterium]